MKLWKKYVVMLSIIAGVVLLTGGQEKFFAWGDEEKCNEEILSIISGGQQDSVPDDKETAPDPGPGAFTVGSPTGAEAPEAEYEFPLMQLLIDASKLPYCPEDPSYQKGKVTLEVVADMDVFLWKDEEKQIPILNPTFSLSEIPNPIWVEVTEPSEEWGDIKFTASYEYKECQDSTFCDTVNATAAVVDLDIINRSDGQALAEEQEDAEGAVVIVNFDDDDQDGGGLKHGEAYVTSDKDDLDGVTGENDLLELKIRRIGNLDTDKEVGFVLDFDSTHIALWRHQEKRPEDQVIRNDTEHPFPISEETTVWVEGKSPHGNIEGTIITLKLLINGEPAGKVYEDSVRVIVPDMVFAILGIVENDQPLWEINAYLANLDVWEKDSIGIVQGKKEDKDVYYSVAVCIRKKQCEQWFKIALRSEDSVVVYNGHSNYGLGPAFDDHIESACPSITNVSAFMNMGRDIYPNNTCQGGFAGINWIKLHKELYGFFTTIEPERIPEHPLNYEIPLLKEEKFPNDKDFPIIGDRVEPGESFTLQSGGMCEGSYEDKCHYKVGDEVCLIVYTGSRDVPAIEDLRYRVLLMNSCKSGRHFFETFRHGVYFYSTRSLSTGWSTMTTFLEEVINGMMGREDEILDYLNQTAGKLSFQYYKW